MSLFKKDSLCVGYSAIVDERDAVGVRIFDTQEKAQHAHYSGLIRLFQLQCRKECNYVIKNLPKSHAAEFNYNNLSRHPLLKNRAGDTFKEDVLFAIVASVFIENGSIRTQQAFDESLKNKNQMLTVANEIGKTVVTIMETAGNIKKQLKQIGIQKELAEDVNNQLDLLVYSGFIRYLPAAQFKAVPRYLKAIESRLDKQKNESQKMQELNRYWKRFWNEVEKKSKKEVVNPEQDKFRWDLEELRVSLFAQQLKTAYPISPKRLEKSWDERG